MARGFESFDRETPPETLPPGLPVKTIGRFLVVTFILSIFLLVVTSGIKDESGALVNADSLNAADTAVLNPLSFGTMTMYWDQRGVTSDLLLSNVRVEGVQASDLELLQIQQRLANEHGVQWAQPSHTGYNEKQFILAHTFKARTGDSARAFASTFFNNPNDIQYIEYPKGKDPFIRFYDICDRYLSEVKHNPDASAELKAYGSSSQMNASLAHLRAKLNLPDNVDLSVVDVRAAFAACAFDIMVYGITKQWCSLMDQAFLNRLDYAEDLEAFYEQGAGFKINYEMAAVLLQDIYSFMKKFTMGETSVVGNLRFGHAETTLPLMTLLGYGDRTKLLASWTDDQINSRGFRTSVLSPTASNIDFRLYRSRTDQKYYVSVWIQEIEAPLPGCDGATYCELSKVEELWGYYLNNYNFKADCALLKRKKPHKP
ncbi:hypothetical protein ON010_g2021 [Phytophthora cinnamomi]|nr:hypothetical protein ON010_g2021 [Phytophthora cinnamomi]